MEISVGCKAILRRLLSQRRIGGKHIPEQICLKWLKNLRKEEYKQTVNDWEWCIKEGMVLTKPKPGGRHVFLNPARLREIKDLIR